MLSLAIGRRGQNVRLASKLTGWKIDVKSETKYSEALRAGYRSLLDVVGVGDVGADTLFQAGYGSAEALTESDARDLASLPGIDLERAEGLIVTAKKYMADREAGLLAASGEDQEDEAAPAAEKTEGESAGESADESESAVEGEAQAQAEQAEPEEEQAEQAPALAVDRPEAGE
jgi:N utilization substance protein A